MFVNYITCIYCFILYYSVLQSKFISFSLFFANDR